MSYIGDDTSKRVRAAAPGLPALEPLPSRWCACGVELVSEAEKSMERCAACDARAFARWDAQRRRDADAALRRDCPSLEALRAELLDAGLRPWQAVKVNAIVRDWGKEPNNRMTPGERVLELRARIVALLGAES